jgi:hypothetical protein
MAHPARLTVQRRTFAPGQSDICLDPHGFKSVNTWRGWRRKPFDVINNADIELFLDQVKYLIKDEVEREVFLDWLAHIEQQPGVLPHYGWLHISEKTGTGRNWLASVLARVWMGYVAPNVDLPALLESSFNGPLSERTLAIVDEVREGSAGGYRHIQKMKSLLNAEFRTINPKYGRPLTEFNCCRWLVFSNHLNAIPLDDADRRWRVVILDGEPRGADVYERLYQALDGESFVPSVANFLASRDISKFKPGERPPLSKAKVMATEASKSDLRLAVDSLLDFCESDLIISEHVLKYITSHTGQTYKGGAVAHVMADAGFKQIVERGGKPVVMKVDGKAVRVWVLRNHDKWAGLWEDNVGKEVIKTEARKSARCLEGLMATDF